MPHPNHHAATIDDNPSLRINITAAEDASVAAEAAKLHAARAAMMEREETSTGSSSSIGGLLSYANTLSPHSARTSHALRMSGYPGSFSSAHSASAAASSHSSSLPQALHGSAHSAMPLPLFSHEALGAYQLRIDAELSAELHSLRHNDALSTHRKAEICLQALEQLAQRCIIDTHTEQQQKRFNSQLQQQQGGSEANAHNAASIIQLLGSSKGGSKAAATAAVAAAVAHRQQEQDPLAVDGVPVAQHHDALRRTILNLRSMLTPLILAPRHVFQQTVQEAEQCAVRHGAIVFETDDTASTKGSNGARRRTGTQQAKHTDAPFDDDEMQRGQLNAKEAAEQALREEQRRAQAAKLAALDAQLRMHDELISEEKRVEMDRNINFGSGFNNPDDSPSAPLDPDEAAAVTAATTASSTKFSLPRDEECSSLDQNAVPYSDVVRMLQFLKGALGARVAQVEREYLAALDATSEDQEQVALLRELNRAKDQRVTASARSDAKLADECASLRAKLTDAYAEVKKARAKNAEIKAMAAANGTSALTAGGRSNRGAEERQAAQARKDSRRAYEDLVMSLKEKQDEISSLVRNIESAQHEKDNLTTQVEILEQAVQTMRYMIKDILQRINEQDDAEQQTNTPTSSSTTAPHVAAGGSASSATPADADALPPAKPTHARRSSTGMLPPVGGALSSSTVQRGGGGGGVTASGAPSTGSAATATSTGHADSRSLGSEGGPVAAVSPPARPMIACRGIGKDVPRFLAYSGWVSKYDLGKRHTELIIKEIWSLKSIADENRRKSGLPRTTLPDFFAMYLRSRFPLAQTDERALHAQMEFVYNFVRSCSLWRSDHDMDLFHQILFGHTSEERYHDQMTMMAHLKKGLAQMDVVDGVRDGFIHKAVFFAGLRQFFPIKSEADMRALIDIVLREMQTECKVGTTGTVVPSSSSVAVGSGGGGDDADGGIKAGGGASSPDAGAVVVSSSGGVAPRSELAVDISKLMAETSDGDESSFINALRKQYEEELNSFPVLIADTLTKASKALFRAAGGAGPLVHVVGGGHGRSHSLSTGLGGRSVSPGPGSLIASSSSDGHGGGGVGVATGLHPALSSSSSGGWLPAGQIAAILQELDPNKSSAEIDAYMRRGLGLDGYFLQHALQGGAQRHEQVLREHGKSDVQGSPTLASMQGISSSPSAVAIGGGHGRHMSVSSSRATTPNHQQQHLRNASRDVLGGSMVTSPEGTVRKGSFNIASISTAAAAQGVRRDSLNNSGSAPSTPLLTSASQGQLVPPSTTRAHSRMSVGAGLTNLAVSPSAGSINAAAGPSPSSPLSQVPMSPTAAAGGASGGGGAALPSASGTSSGRNSRESSRRSSASKNVVMGHMSVGADGRIHANYTHVRSGSRSRSRGHSRSTSMMGSIAGFAQQGVVGTLGTGATGGIGGTGIPGAAGATSYDPSMFVELSLFLSRLNTLFLHRTGHYNADLDLAGLRKLIKDELERAADDERKARELAAAKKGLGTGLQVNALALPSWAALFPTWKRVANDPHIRAEVFNALAHKYSKNPPPQQQTSANDEMDQRPSSGASQASRSSSHRSGARTPATTLSTEPVTPADALAALALPSTPESRFAVNESFNQIVTYYRGDSTKLQVDAIVNAANPALVAGGGICAAIFAAAGHAQLSKACAKLGGASYGSTKVTPGFKLPSRFVLHTVSPVNPSDSAVLESCYNSILDACLARGLRSVAMCCLATGITGFRHVDAAEIALRTTRTWLENHQDPVSKALPLDRIVFTVFTEEDLHIYNALLTIFFPCAEHGSTHPTPGVGASGSQWPLNAKAGEGAEEDNRRRSLGSSLDSARAWAAEKAAEALSTAPLARAAAATASTATTTHRKGRHGRTGSIGLGLGGPLDLSLAQAPLEAAAAASLTAAEQSLASLNSLKLKRQQQQQQAGSGAGGRSLAAYRYELPPSLVHKPAPPPKTAAEVFHSGTVAHFVPPPVKPKQPEAGQQSSSAVPMKEYHAQRSGTGVTSAPHSAQMMASVSSGASSSSRGKHPKTSAPKSGLAKLMSRSSAAHDDGEDDDD